MNEIYHKNNYFDLYKFYIFLIKILRYCSLKICIQGGEKKKKDEHCGSTWTKLRQPKRLQRPRGFDAHRKGMQRATPYGRTRRANRRAAREWPVSFLNSPPCRHRQKRDATGVGTISPSLISCDPRQHLKCYYVLMLAANGNVGTCGIHHKNWMNCYFTFNACDHRFNGKMCNQQFKNKTKKNI